MATNFDVNTHSKPGMVTLRAQVATSSDPLVDESKPMAFSIGLTPYEAEFLGKAMVKMAKKARKIQPNG